MNVTLAAAIRDEHLLGGPFKAASFWPWHAVAKLISGERLDRREAALFKACTGRTKLPRKAVRRFYMLAGRRAGKDRFFSAAAVHMGALAGDWRETFLSAGEQAIVTLLGSDRRQAAILKRYCAGLVRAPLLAAEVVRETAETIEFANGGVLEVGTNDARLVRGRSALAVLGSEVCFWRTDEASASNDEEVVAAAEPSMAMSPGGGLLMLASSPHMKRGLMFRKWRELFGNNDAEDIVWRAPSRTMNPALPAEIVEKALAEDPERARSEYLAEWRDDLSDFVPAEVIDQATDYGVRERAPESGVCYVAFTDAAGGTGSDSFTLGVAHVDTDGKAVLDVLRERKPRFVPAAVVAEFAELLKTYRVAVVRGDRYAAGWNSDEWSRVGIEYRASDRTKSEIYLAGLPLLLSGRARLLDSAGLRQQLGGLARRVHAGGRESVDHGSPYAHDDLSNAAIGALVAAATSAEEFTGPVVGRYGLPSRFGQRSGLSGAYSYA